MAAAISHVREVTAWLCIGKVQSHFDATLLFRLSAAALLFAAVTRTHCRQSVFLSGILGRLDAGAIYKVWLHGTEIGVAGSARVQSNR